MEAVDPPLLEGVQDHLGIGMVGQPTVPAELLELAADIKVVVDLAVVDEPERAVLVRHRLIGFVGEVDDLEPSKAKANAAVVGDPQALTVRPSMDERLPHAFEVLPRDDEVVRFKRHRADYPAHRYSGLHG